MKKLLICLSALSLVLLFSSAHANGPVSQTSKPGLSYDATALSHTQGIFGKKKKKRRKRKGKRWLAAGVVFGQPTGFGGRVLVTPWRFGIAADVSFDQITLDNGMAAGATTVKLDGRFYGKGIFCNFLRPYAFGGITTTMANFNEFDKNLIRVDAGIGGEMRIWRIGINGEMGLLLPTERVQNYRQGVGLFGNVGVLLFLM